MFLHRPGRLDRVDSRQRPDLLVLAQRRERDRLPRRAAERLFLERQFARAIGPDRGIGEDHDRRLEPLRAVDRHHPDLIAPLARLALQFALAGIEPADETLEAGHMRAGEGVGGIQQFVDRIVGLAPQPGDQTAPPIQRADQHPVEQLLRAVVVGAAQHLAQAVDGTADQRRIAFAQMLPQALAPRAIAVFEQIFLAPSAQRRDQQAGERQIVERLRCEAQRRHQIPDCQRIAQPQPVDPGHGDAVAIEPRDDQRGQFAAFLHQHHDIARRGTPRRRALRQRQPGPERVEPARDLLRYPVGQLAVVPRQPAFAPLTLVFVILVRVAGPHFLPQRHQPGLGAALVRIAAPVEPEPFVADGIDRAVDEAEHLAIGAIAAFEPVLLQPPHLGRLRDPPARPRARHRRRHRCGRGNNRAPRGNSRGWCPGNRRSPACNRRR